MGPSGRLRTWVQILGFSVIACGSRVDALDTPKKSNPGGRGASTLWTSCDVDKLAAAHVGDRCNFGGQCWDNPDFCHETIYTCQGGALTIGETDLLDCAPMTVIQPNPVGWITCSDAMASGHLGDTCTGMWSCATNDDDPCCIDFGYCEQSGIVSTREHTFAKARFCQKDCASIPVRTGVATVDACVPLTTTPQCQRCQLSAIPISGTPCTGTFVCDSYTDVSQNSMLDVTFAYGLDRLYWCRDGVLQSLYQ
jgi:hypothetical protein